jgi:hypothetical protein
MFVSKSKAIRTGLDNSEAAIAQATATSVERDILPPKPPPSLRV